MIFFYKSILQCIQEEIARAETRMRPVVSIEVSQTEFNELEAEVRASCPHLPPFPPGDTPTIEGIPIKIKESLWQSKFKV